MKKLIVILTLLALVATMAFSAFAATGISAAEQAILDKLSAGIKGEGGWTFELPQEYINSAKNYFAGDYEMTPEQKAAIIAYINQGLAVIKKEAENQKLEGGKLTISDMSEEARQEVLQLGKDVCNEIDLNMSYNPSGNKVVITTQGSKTPLFESSNVIKTTGETFPMTASSVIAATVAILVMGTAAMFVFAKKNGLLVK